MDRMRQLPKILEGIPIGVSDSTRAQNQRSAQGSVQVSAALVIVTFQGIAAPAGRE